MKPAPVELPHGDKFKDIWQMWVEDRKERKRPLTAAAIKIQLKKLSEVTEEEAVMMIETSINKGWIGIFPLREQDKPKKPAIYL